MQCIHCHVSPVKYCCSSSRSVLIPCHSTLPSCQWEVSYEMPIRIEDGGYPYTVLKGKLLKSLKIMSSVDHTLLNGQGIASLHVAIDHFNDDFKVGVSLKLQS
jgi:hypothetical protein